MPSTPPQQGDPRPHRVTGVGSGGAGHRARPAPRPARRTAALLGAAAALVAVGVGSAALLMSPGPVPSTPTSAQHITVTPTVPLSEPDIVALLHRPPDFGALTVPGRRASCLSGLGYPAATRALGARPIEVAGAPGILLVLPGGSATELTAVVVAPNCNAADTGLLAQTTVARPDPGDPP